MVPASSDERGADKIARNRKNTSLIILKQIRCSVVLVYVGDME